MTLIVCKNGIVAADSYSFDNYSNVLQKNAKKLFLGTIPVGLTGNRRAIFAISGKVILAHAACRAISHGVAPEESGEGKEYAVLVLDDAGMVYSKLPGTPFSVHENTHAVLGAAFEFAYGALATGATAYETVRAACKERTDVGGEVVAASFSHPDIGVLHLPTIPRSVEWLKQP